MTLLRVEGLSVRFGGLQALAEVSFAVERGAVFALIGPNGAGKTTIFNVLTGLYRPSAGEVALDEQPLLPRLPHEIARLGVARTFQNTEVFGRLSVLDNVLVGAHQRWRIGIVRGALGLPSVWRAEAHARERAKAILERLGLEASADVEAGSLPLGVQKRVEVARALAAEPRVLLLDEPAGGLNPTETRDLMDLIRRLRDEDGLTVLLVEHDMALVMGLSDRVAVLHHGRKIAEGKPREIAADPLVIDAYLGGDDVGDA
jgi:branched-chain amino acid transport system ATP-binding protein